jgi:hypothetical protein
MTILLDYKHLSDDEQYEQIRLRHTENMVIERFLAAAATTYKISDARRNRPFLQRLSRPHDQKPTATPLMSASDFFLYFAAGSTPDKEYTVYTLSQHYKQLLLYAHDVHESLRNDIDTLVRPIVPMLNGHNIEPRYHAALVRTGGTSRDCLVLQLALRERRYTETAALFHEYTKTIDIDVLEGMQRTPTPSIDALCRTLRMFRNAHGKRIWLDIPQFSDVTAALEAHRTDLEHTLLYTGTPAAVYENRQS